MKKPEEIRKSVADTYAKAVTSAGGSGCCGASVSSCCQPVVSIGKSGASPQNAITEAAGYSRGELDSLPAAAVESAFGCGNPLAYSEVQPGETVLDLGSGAGIDILLAAQKVGPSGRVIGVDMTDEMLAKARENIAAAGLDNVEVRKGLIEELPVESSSVDWVISNCVINLSPEKDRVFAEIARVLAPGGQVLVSDIVAKDLPQWIVENSAMYSSCVAGAISEEEYLAGLRAAGLEAVEVRERLVYESDQIAAFASSDEAGQVVSCCIPENLAAQIGDSLAGKIWSAKFYARKPRP